jgi:hypothetical protein
VAVHEFGQVNGLPFFIMEFVDGPNLRQLEQAGKLSPREALQIVPQICEALQFAHDEGVVHRDIKPENILLDKKGRVKIADFGIAKIMGQQAEAELTETKGALGTPHYMAPEQVERPQAVDHRADIFALGVVFYEMLTGELPLGKFAPPSSKVQVDVRLDEVVLRSLEKEPERRYQQASQVRTAVETIASTTPPPPSPDARVIAEQVLARDYTLSIGSCLRRGWALVRNNFWPVVGISALITVLLAVAHSAGVVMRADDGRTVGGGSVLGILLNGPLMGGLYLFFLKKIRGEVTTVETAFSGFSNRFLHLFLGSFVSLTLIFLGFLCLILPGIYLLVAWAFTLPLIIDKRLDFWSAMELSRRTITKHWWKFFGFVLVLWLLKALGLVACIIGYFVLAPIAIASLMYAYEDILGSVVVATPQPPVNVGPHGTAVLPAKQAGGSSWRPAIAVGAAVIAFVVLGVFVAILFTASRRNAAQAHAMRAQMAEKAARAAIASQLVFGPAVEQVIQARGIGTNQFLDLDTGRLLTPSPQIAQVLAAQPGEDEARFWHGLDIPANSRRGQYLAWLRESGADLMFDGNGRIIAFDGLFAQAHDNRSENWEDWDGITPENVRDAMAVLDWNRRANEAQRGGRPPPRAPESGGVFDSAVQLDSQYAGGPRVNLLTRDQSMLWLFQTRDGAKGVLQILAFTDEPSAVKIRYRTITSGANQISADKHEELSARLEAALMIGSQTEKDKALGVVAADAAKAGEAEIVSNAIEQIGASSYRDQAALDSVRLLAKRGLRKEAIRIAQRISGTSTRDLALTELAQ